MSFKNNASEKFYEFFDRKLKSKEISLTELAEKFDKYKKNPGVLLRSLKSGRNGVTVELIELAQKHFGLNPNDLFNGGGMSNREYEQTISHLEREVNDLSLMKSALLAEKISFEKRIDELIRDKELLQKQVSDLMEMLKDAAQESKSKRRSA